MFGQNQPRGPEEHPALQVAEIFNTIQGEGPFAGRPAVFVRLTGCNLRCWFCDTTWGDDTDPRLTPAEIGARVREIAGSSSLVVITGGEPLRQPLGELIRNLTEPDDFDALPFHVQIETAGTYWQECLLGPKVSVVVSPKTSRVHRIYAEHGPSFYWKYVIRDGEVGESGFPTAPMQRHIKKPDERVGGAPFVPPTFDPNMLFFQPMDEYLADGSRDEAAQAANTRAMVSAAIKTGGRAGLQLHKLFDLP